MKTTLSWLKWSWFNLAIVACLGLLWIPTPSPAQRPSLGGLQLQINELRSGDLAFDVVAFGEECRIFLDEETQAFTFQDPHKFCFKNPNLPPCVGIPGGIVEFGPQCTVGLDPLREGLIFSDVGCFVFENPTGAQTEISVADGFISFGPECSFGIDPNLTGLVEKDPGGLRLLGRDGRGCILTFGRDDLCRVLVDPKRQIGMIFEDPFGFNFENPLGGGEATVFVDGLVFAQEFIQESSRDLKENIRTIDNAVETVKQLRGVYFDWKNDKRPGDSDLGFIAEEVGKVVSEAVVYSKDGTKAKGVKYANLVAVVVEGMKSQQKQIETQQKLIEQLQEEVSDLRQNK